MKRGSPTGVLTQECEHPYELTIAKTWNGGRDIEIRCARCDAGTVVMAYKILVARDVAVMERVQQLALAHHQELPSGPHGSPAG